MKQNKIISGCVFILLLILCSCDNSLEPVDQETGTYSVYGVLDLNEAPNYIRVRDLKIPFTAEATKEIDAEVILQNLDSNSTERLEDIKTQFNGVFQHNFEVGRIFPDTEYRLTVKNAAGEGLEFVAKTPSILTKSISPDNRDCFTETFINFGNTNGGNMDYVLDTVAVKGDESRGISFLEAFYLKKSGTLLANDEEPTEPLFFDFIPGKVLNTNLGIPRPLKKCSDLMFDRYVITYIYYSKGLQEKVANDPFDILSSTARFGAFYSDTIVVKFDTNSGKISK
ncbi:MAG: hypothetical protein ABJR05_02070 [Balneola sp.]